MEEPSQLKSSTSGEKLPASKALKKCCSEHWKGKFTIIVPILLSPILIYGLCIDNQAYTCLYLVLLMAFFWVTECIPLYITSIFPVVYLPLFGILDSASVTRLYMTNTLVMFLGGLILALGMEYSQLHHRIAISTIRFVGCSPRRLHIGMVIVTAFISLWISNTACAAMMCPIIKAVLEEMNDEKIFTVYMTQEEEPVEESGSPHPSKLSMAFYFGIAYASTIGGTGTLIGTATNLTLKGIYDARFPHSEENINFPNFMLYACPFFVVSNIVLLILALQITHMGLFRKNSREGQEVSKGKENAYLVENIVKERYKKLGRVNCHELQIIILFIVLIFMLFLRTPGFMVGWADFLNTKTIQDSVTIMLPCILLFALPTNYAFFKYFYAKPPFPSAPLNALLSWTFASYHIPWGLYFLLGGGFALAEGSRVSGMSVLLGNALSFLNHFPNIIVQLVCIVIGIVFTAFSSNVAICNILLPIFAELSVSVNVHPLLLMLPPAMAISTSYHLPVSTPPNAIVCGYANIKVKYLIVAGILPSVISVLTLLINANSWGFVVYPGSKEYPDWLKDVNNKTLKYKTKSINEYI